MVNERTLTAEVVHFQGVDFGGGRFGLEKLLLNPFSQAMSHYSKDSSTRGGNLAGSKILATGEESNGHGRELGWGWQPKIFSTSKGDARL